MTKQPDFDLDADEIITAAVEILEEFGLDAVSMRNVSSRLGVSPVPLYSRIGNKDALLDAIADRLLADLAPPTGEGEPWDQYAVRWARELRTRLRRARDSRAIRAADDPRRPSDDTGPGPWCRESVATRGRCRSGGGSDGVAAADGPHKSLAAAASRTARSDPDGRPPPFARSARTRASGTFVPVVGPKRYSDRDPLSPPECMISKRGGDAWHRPSPPTRGAAVVVASIWSPAVAAGIVAV